MDKLARFIYCRSKLIIVFVILVSIISLFSFTRYSMDTDFLNFFSADNLKAEQYNQLNEKYHSREMLTVLVEAEGSLLDKNALIAVYRLQQNLANLEGVVQVQSFIPPEVQVQGSNIRIDENIIAAYSAPLGSFIKDSYFLADQYLSADSNSGIIIVQLQPDVEAGNVITAIREAGAGAEGLVISLTGDQVIKNTLQEDLFRVLTVLPPFTVALVLLVFFIMLRNWFFTILAIVPAGLAALWTFGTVFWSGQQLNLVTVLCPIFIIVVGSAYGLHFVSHFQESLGRSSERSDQLADTFRRVGPPIILSMITTMAGFVSLALADVLPMREMGIFVTAGIAYAGFLALFFIPALLVKAKLNVRPVAGVGSRLVEFITAVSKRKIAVILVFLALLAVSGFYITSIEVVSDTLMFFKPDSEIRQAFEQVEQSFGGALPLTGEIAAAGGLAVLADYDYAQQVLADERELEGLDGIKSVFSVFDLVASISEMTTGEVGYPENAEAVKTIMAQLGDNNLSIWVADDGLRLMIKTSDLSADDILKLELYVAEHSDSIRMIAGMPILFDEMNQMVVRSQIRSLGLALLLVFLMLLIMLRKVSAALAGLVPIVITIAAILGMISFTGFHLNLLTASLSAIAVGVGVDYSVHIISAIHYYRRQGEQPPDSVRLALTSVTRPVLANAFGLAIGMSVLFFSPLNLHLQAASMMWVAMVVSSLAALLLIPIIYTKI